MRTRHVISLLMRTRHVISLVKRLALSRYMWRQTLTTICKTCSANLSQNHRQLIYPYTIPKIGDIDSWRLKVAPNPDIPSLIILYKTCMQLTKLNQPKAAATFNESNIETFLTHNKSSSPKPTLFCLTIIKYGTKINMLPQGFPKYKGVNPRGR